jgi:hypothetical protein
MTIVRVCQKRVFMRPVEIFVKQTICFSYKKIFIFKYSRFCLGQFPMICHIFQEDHVPKNNIFFLHFSRFLKGQFPMLYHRGW